MKQFIKDLWTITVERYRISAAVRRLVKQEWSVELLVSLLNKARDAKRDGIYFVLTHRDGTRLEIRAESRQPNMKAYADREKELDLLQDSNKLQAMLDAAEIQGYL